MREKQYNNCLEIRDRYGLTPLGLMTNQVWWDDPRRLVFSLARYKFVSKMLAGKKSALEVGCGDGFASRIVRQVVPDLTLVDFDPVFIDDIHSRMTERWRVKAFVHDILAGPVPGCFEGIYSLDVMEHIPQDHETMYLGNVIGSLADDGLAIIGLPSLESQQYASPPSKAGHVNCKTGADFKRVLDAHFANVLVFSMNDEVVHTGFYPMAHYLLGVCSQPRR